MVSLTIVLLKELVLSMVGRIAFKVILERLATRMVILGLRKLAKLTTNNVDDALAEDLIASLQDKKLPVADGTIK